MEERYKENASMSAIITAINEVKSIISYFRWSLSNGLIYREYKDVGYFGLLNKIIQFLIMECFLTFIEMNNNE